VWHCPSYHAPPSQDERIAYGWNAYGYNAFGLEAGAFDDTFGLGGHKGARASSENPPVREWEVLNPSDMMALGDGLDGGYFPQLCINDGSRFLRRLPVVTERGGEREPYNDRTGSTQRAKRRHRGKANVLFCDGHAESPALIFLFQATNDAALVRWNRDHLPHPDRLWQLVRQLSIPAEGEVAPAADLTVMRVAGLSVFGSALRDAVRNQHSDCSGGICLDLHSPERGHCIECRESGLVVFRKSRAPPL
jgi:prepilin-type processing-associated H-X9-DG protein